jgi:phosphoribosylformylglycinamidine (FGAM) synthase-like enzyme
MNFGNPEKPEVMGQFVGAVRGISAACRALDFPVVSGNVSLYNETQGVAILPTPAIGGLGVIEDAARAVGLGVSAGQDLVLIGQTLGHLGQSLWLREIAGREDGAPPPVDLAAERRNGDFVREAIGAGLIEACHDVSDGGVLVAVTEMTMEGGVGATLSAEVPLPGTGSLTAHGFWFGEDQGRYIAATRDAGALLAHAADAGVPALLLGSVEGVDLTLPKLAPISLRRLVEAHRRFFPAWMDT